MSICDWIDNAVVLPMDKSDAPIYGQLHFPCRVQVNTKIGAGVTGIVTEFTVGGKRHAGVEGRWRGGARNHDRIHSGGKRRAGVEGRRRGGHGIVTEFTVGENVF